MSAGLFREILESILLDFKSLLQWWSQGLCEEDVICEKHLGGRVVSERLLEVEVSYV